MVKQLVVPEKEEADVLALKAVAKGVASSGQQQRALNYIINLTGIREMPSFSENTNETMYKNGQKSIGWMIARIVELTGVTADVSTNKKEA